MPTKNKYEAHFYKSPIEEKDLMFIGIVIAADIYEANNKFRALAEITCTYYGDVKWVGKE